MASPAVPRPVLLALHERELHGYGLAKTIEGRAESQLRLQPANLYRRIHRLVETGLVESSGRCSADDAEGERRRFFRITDKGREVLKAEAYRLRGLVQAAAALRIVPRLDKLK